MRSFRFNGHPPLGVNATHSVLYRVDESVSGFNGHPPLGVNATAKRRLGNKVVDEESFQWAPTLRGECYNGRLLTPDGTRTRFQWAPTLRGECYKN